LEAWKLGKKEEEMLTGYRRIMTAPYDNEGWEMDCIPLGGSVYMELYDPPEARAKR
jgi:RAT1-interacting protein